MGGKKKYINIFGSFTVPFNYKLYVKNGHRDNYLSEPEFPLRLRLTRLGCTRLQQQHDDTVSAQTLNILKNKLQKMYDDASFARLSSPRR